MAALHIVLLAALLMKPGYWTLLVVFSSVGIAIGGIHPIFSTLIAVAFGSRAYGAVHGRMNIVTQPLQLLSIYIVGAAYDRTGTYDPAFWLFAGFVVVAILLISAVRLGPQESAERSGGLTTTGPVAE